MSTPFTIENLPYGVISTTSNPKLRCATAFETNAVELESLEEDGFFEAIPGFEGQCIFGQKHLNSFAALPKESHAEVRRRLIRFLSTDSRASSTKYVTPLDMVTNHLPMNTYNFSDFYCSLEHAENCATIMKVNMQPNWFTVPSVYCGRTSSLRVSGTPVTRPRGVVQDTPSSSPVYTATQKLDFELKMGIIVSKPLPPGQRVTTEQAKDHIFGFVILNDWSSRDIQSFEMPPLGPFHSKGFMTSISPWIVTMEALECSETARTIPQNPSPLPHLAWNGEACRATFNIDLSVRIIRQGKTYQVASTNLRELYWTPYQQLTHLVSAGEALETGDIFGTGTISSDRVNAENEKNGLACLLERVVPQNQLSILEEDNLAFLEDDDEVVMEAWFIGRDGERRGGFGSCRGTVRSANLET